VKLRIHGNSLRLRLNRSDVERLRETGICTESLRFGPGSQLSYMLEASPQATLIEVEYGENCIRVVLPRDMAQAWVGSDQISLCRERAEPGRPSLLIEKDFQCLHRKETANDEADAFSNPSAGDQHARRL